MDIGPDSLKAFQSALADAKTIIWNGPMGVFEFEKFAKGTFGVADTLAELSAKVSCLHAVAAHAICDASVTFHVSCNWGIMSTRLCLIRFVSHDLDSVASQCSSKGLPGWQRLSLHAPRL